MADLTQFLPVRSENVASVRARMDADVNAGLLPTDPAYRDLTPGGYLSDMLTASALEIARVWDFLGIEVPAVAFVVYAFGEYLDLQGINLGGVERKDEVQATGTATFEGPNGTLIATGTQVGTLQTDPDADPIEFETTGSGTISGGSIDLPVRALVPGTAGNVPPGSISVLLSSVPGLTAVVNAAGTTGGADVESDEAYLERLLRELTSPHGAGTIADYQRWALDYPGIGFVTVTPLWNGAGTVRVIVTDSNNDPSSSTVVDGLQNVLDPVPGQGLGLAPIGASVTVDTVSTLGVNVASTLALVPGYSLDGTEGSVAVRTDVESAIRDYIDLLPPGEDVIRNRVIEFVMAVFGVSDILSLTLNGVAANLPVAPLRVAQVGTVTLGVL